MKKIFFFGVLITFYSASIWAKSISVKVDGALSDILKPKVEKALKERYGDNIKNVSFDTFKNTVSFDAPENVTAEDVKPILAGIGLIPAK